MFQIKIPVPQPEQAFEWLSTCIRRLEWYMANGRSNRMDFFRSMKSPLIQEMVDGRHCDKKTFKDNFFQRFNNELYSIELYDKSIQRINNVLPVVQSCYPEIEQLHKNWGFEILPAYHIDIDIFSVGGRYHRDEKNIGHIILGLGGGLAKQSELAHILVHEMIHLGIEQLVINPNRLEKAPVHQEEKERIVDNLCIYVTQKHIPDYGRQWKNGTISRYQEIAKECAYMDKIVGNQPHHNLVQSVQKFLKENNRC